MSKTYPISLNRRHVLAGGLSAGAVTSGLTGPLFAADGKIEFGVGSNAWAPDFEGCLTGLSKIGFDGVEPFATNIAPYRADPAKLKAILDKTGLQLISCSSPVSPTATDFLDPTKADQVIKENAEFARDFLRVFGCKHFKLTFGPRRGDTLMTTEQLKQLAATMNELGRRTSEWGIKAAPHPSINSPIERESELRAFMEMTDPRYVALVTDTGHLTLGGMDPAVIIRDYLPRIAEVHLKDVEGKYKGWTGPSYRDPRPYRMPGTANAGGVDYVDIYKLLKDRGYSGFVSLDIDGTDLTVPTIDLVKPNVRYLVETLKLPLKLQ